MRKLPLIILPLLVFLSISCDINNDSPNTFKLSANITPEEGGVVNPSGGDFKEESEVEITAEPAEGFVFQGWEGDLNGQTNPASITFDSDKNVTALFERKTYELTINVEGEGKVQENVVIAAKSDHEHGATVQIDAQPEQGWHFVEWRGDITGTTNPERFVADGPKTVTAVFELNEHTVNTSVEGQGTVVIEPEKDMYTYGEEITITAEPEFGWRLLEWSGDLTGDENPAVTEVDKDMEITAVLIPVEDPLLGMGYNHNGQLGNGNTIEQHTPTRNIYNVRDVAAGAFHSMFIDTDGDLWGMGFNEFGQLGNGNDQDQHEQTRIDSDVSKVSAGEHHTLFIKEDGTLWAMGENTDGQLGDGTNTHRQQPVQIDSDVVDVAAGAWHSIYVKSDGTLWAMGLNNFGQLGDNTNENKNTPVQIDSDVEKVAAGKRHSLYIKNNGTLFGMGRNAEGQLGIGGNTTTNLPNPDQFSPVQIDNEVDLIAGGTDHTLYVKTNGTLWATGNNEFGQLGDGTTTNRISPVQIANNAIDIAAGNRHSLFVSTDNVLWAMGFNGNGQLGDGTTTNRATPVRVDEEVNEVSAGINHSLYIKD